MGIGEEVTAISRLFNQRTKEHGLFFIPRRCGDANGKKLLDEQNGGELPLVMFDGWFDEIRTKAAESGATMLLVDTYKRNRDKEKQTYSKQELINGKWKKPREITFDEYASLFD